MTNDHMKSKTAVQKSVIQELSEWTLVIYTPYSMEWDVFHLCPVIPGIIPKIIIE